MELYLKTRDQPGLSGTQITVSHKKMCEIDSSIVALKNAVTSLTNLVQSQSVQIDKLKQRVLVLENLNSKSVVKPV